MTVTMIWKKHGKALMQIISTKSSEFVTPSKIISDNGRVITNVIEIANSLTIFLQILALPWAIMSLQLHQPLSHFLDHLHHSVCIFQLVHQLKLKKLLMICLLIKQLVHTASQLLFWRLLNITSQQDVYLMSSKSQRSCLSLKKARELASLIIGQYPYCQILIKF